MILLDQASLGASLKSRQRKKTFEKTVFQMSSLLFQMSSSILVIRGKGRGFKPYISYLAA
jgi:hypothetical protein